MDINELTSTLLRRRTAFALTFVACVVGVIVATLLVPKTYEASATLYVGSDARGSGGSPVLDTSQGEQLARTFTTLASNPAMADAVLAELDDGTTRSELLGSMSFTPVERTQLLQITAKGESPERATLLANVYSQTFVEQINAKSEEDTVPSRVTLSEAAVVPTEAASPNVPLYLGFGFVLAGLLALGAAVARDRLDRRLRVDPSDDVVLGWPILGRIPKSRTAPLASQSALRAHLPATSARSDGAFDDAFRVLRTNVELAPAATARTILVTSPGIGEGKTTIAAQFALAAARDGDSVTLIECDMRRPSLDLSSVGRGLARTTAGLTRYLAGEVTTEEVIRRDPALKALSVVYAGTVDSAPTRLLRSPRLPYLLTHAQERSDWVLLDTPPITVSDDALFLTRLAEGTLYIIDPQRTQLPRARSGLARLEKVGARVLGVVVNRTSDVSESAYYVEGAGAQRDASPAPPARSSHAAR